MDHVELFGTIRLQDRSEKRRAMARRMCVCAVCVLCVCCVCARAQLAYHSKQVTRPTPSPIFARPLSNPSSFAPPPASTSSWEWLSLRRRLGKARK